MPAEILPAGIALLLACVAGLDFLETYKVR